MFVYLIIFQYFCDLIDERMCFEQDAAVTLLCEMTSEGHTSRGKETERTANAGEILTEGSLVGLLFLFLLSHSRLSFLCYIT